MAWLCVRSRGLPGVVAAALLLLLGACASGPPKAHHMPVGQLTRAPSGYLDFCLREPKSCPRTAEDAKPEQLTETRWAELNAVNFGFNRAIRPVTDLKLLQKSEYWQYPTDAGDCEDYALAKQRELLHRGWRPETLLLATARNPQRELHAVLVVATDHGDFVLDNATNAIEAWDHTPYQWVSRQMPGDPLMWRRAGAESSTMTTAALR